MLFDNLIHRLKSKELTNNSYMLKTLALGFGFSIPSRTGSKLELFELVYLKGTQR